MTDLPPFRLLVIADLHWAPSPDANHPARRMELGIELLRRALDDARHRGGFDAIALMGDLLNTPDEPANTAALAEIRRQINLVAPHAPLLAVPGNHDGDPKPLLAALDCPPGLHEIAGYRFVTFADTYAHDDVCTRTPDDLQRLAQLPTAPGPIVCLQHNPIHPVIDDPYPYMPSNRADIMDQYERAGVILSISGHAHLGQPLTTARGVAYFTAPALCDAPFSYAVLTLQGRHVSVQTHRLQLPAQPPVFDCHVHTHFAYCGRNLDESGIIERARLMGAAGIVLVEHAPQLYCLAEDFWVANHVRQPGLWQRDDHSRMDQFRAAMDQLRSDYVKIGLEVELDSQGQLTLRDEDRDWADILVGAVHFLNREIRSLGDQELADDFMKATEGLLLAGVDILAHPLRLFRWAGRTVPHNLFAPLAVMLAQSGTAAEINFHGNSPDAEFLACCLEQGVKISFGSDTHEMHEVANLGANLDMLRQAAGRDDVHSLLFLPRP